jgi:L-alanine-DL-glutamate epimerase-like enolase superfamily enzyme
MPHSFYDGPGLMAAIHATAALGTADSMIEWRWFDLEETIYGRVLKPKHGRISVPQGAGLGIDPDERAGAVAPAFGGARIDRVDDGNGIIRRGGRLGERGA